MLGLVSTTIAMFSDLHVWSCVRFAFFSTGTRLSNTLGYTFMWDVELVTQSVGCGLNVLVVNANNESNTLYAIFKSSP